MTELVVAVAEGAGSAPLTATLQSLLEQDRVDLEIVVVAAGDPAANPVPALRDDRIRVIRGTPGAAEASSWQLALVASASRSFGVIRAGAIALPGALRGLLDALERSPRAVVAHAYWFPSGGPRSRDDHRRRRARLDRTIGPRADPSRILDAGLGPLRVYRRAALDDAGGFHGDEGGSEETRRLAARGEVAVVTRHLVVAERDRPGASPDLGGSSIARRFLRRRRHGDSLWVGALPAALDGLYDRIVVPLAPLAVRLLRAPRPRERSRGRTVAYHLWHYPVVSQTFIARELGALARAGLRVEVVADGADAVELAGRPAEPVTYLPPAEIPPRISAAAWRFLLRHPLRGLAVFAFVTLCRHSAHKHVLGDRAVFARAALLAATLEARGIGHLHAPWADRSALVALGAARLLGVPFSMQTRAHDLHRDGSHHGRRELCAAARFVVTNTRYNRRHLERWMPPGRENDVVVIANGLDLERFVPSGRTGEARSPVRILCVGRLIEQKGIGELLEACAVLRDRGLDFTCEIVGGPEEPLYRNEHLRLRKLHRRLLLERHVAFLGALPFAQVLERYAAADLLALPSVVAADGSRDVIPNAILEGMAMGLPIVATPVTGIPELVTDGEEGLLVPPRDVVALVEALERLIRDPSLRLALGRRGRLRVERDFDVDRNVARYVELFRASIDSISGGERRAPADRAGCGRERGAPPARTSV